MNLEKTWSLIITSLSVHLVPGKIMENFFLWVIEKHLKEYAVITRSKHGFVREQSCSMNLSSFYDKVTYLIDQGKTVDIIFLDYRRGFDTVSYGVFLDKIFSTQLDKYIIWWVWIGWQVKLKDL